MLTAIKNDGREVFYDVVNIEPTKIKAPAGTAEESTSGSKSTETIERAGESAAENAESGGKRHPTPSTAIIQNEEADVNGQTLRETYGLREAPTQERKQRQVEQKLRSWDVSGNGAKTLSQYLPTGTNADTYAAAASSLYRLGQMEDVDTFDRALQLAGTENHLGLNVAMVLEKPTGRNALEMAYTLGRGEREARAQRMEALGGVLGSQDTSSGTTTYEGTLRDPADAVSRIIELNARGTGTDAVLKSVLDGPDGAPNPNVRAYVDTETKKIFFGDSAQDVFGTVLHEDYHWYNALDPEGARRLQDHALLYLAEKNGYEDIDALIRARMGDYAAQRLTYEQAAEELVADAWGGIFDSEESFRQWAQFQRSQAEKNAGRAGNIHRVMEQVKDLLDNILQKAREVLRLDPENTAARRAQRLAEAEKRALQEEYFAHAEQAMENLRAAKENAAAPGKERAAEKAGVRYQIDADFEKAIDELDIDSDRRYAIRVGTTSEILKSIGVKDRDIVWQAGKVRKILNKHSIANHNPVTGSGSVMTKEILKQVPQVLEHPILVVHSDTSRNADYASRIFMYGDVVDVAGKPVNVSLELLPTDRKGLAVENIVLLSAYGHDGYRPGRVLQGEILYVDPDTKRTSRWLRGNRLSLPFSLTNAGPKAILRYSENGVKAVDVEPLPGQQRYYLKSVTEEQAQRLYPESEADRTSETEKKTKRFQLSSPVEANGEKELVAVHNLTEENLQEALELGGMPSPSIAVVKARDGHSKYGPVSLVFRPDSIDPQASRANRVYGSDAWTPTRPGVEYEVNDRAAERFETMVSKASEAAFEGKFRSYSALRSMTADDTSQWTRAELAQKLSGQTAVQLAYLAEKGIRVDPEYKAVQQEYDSLGQDALDKLVELAGEDKIRDVFENGNFEALDRLADTAADALTETKTHGTLQSQNLRWEKRIERMRTENRQRLYKMAENAYKMLTDTGSGETEMDVEGTRTKIEQAAPAEDVKNWVYEKLDGVIGQKGIRNGRERFTPSGNRRSFAQLHNPYTLENLVQAMNQQQEARGQGVFGASATALMSTATAEYKSLDEVRADKGRLQQMPEAEYKALLEKADAQVDRIIDRLRSETTPHSDNSFEEREILGTVLMTAAQGKQTAAAIGKAFAKEGYSIGKDTAEQIRALYKEVAQIPTGYFEAKPQRAVGFDEVQAAILPDNASSTLVDSLKEHGVPVYQYKAGDDAQRTKLLNEVPGVRFQMAENADKEARANRQRQASRAIAQQDAAMKTLMDFFTSSS